MAKGWALLPDGGKGGWPESKQCKMQASLDICHLFWRQMSEEMGGEFFKERDRVIAIGSIVVDPPPLISSPSRVHSVSYHLHFQSLILPSHVFIPTIDLTDGHRRAYQQSYGTAVSCGHTPRLATKECCVLHWQPFLDIRILFSCCKLLLSTTQSCIGLDS